MYISITFFTFIIVFAYCLLSIINWKKIDNYAKKNMKKFVAFQMLFFVSYAALMIFISPVFNYNFFSSAKEISTGHIYRLRQAYNPLLSLSRGDGRFINEFILFEKNETSKWKIIEFSLNENGEIDTYTIENLKTGEQKKMKHLDKAKKITKVSLDDK